MHVWILTKHSDTEYENARLIQEFSEMGVETTLVNPAKFNVILKHTGKNTIKYDNKQVEYPDALLIRTGSGTDYHALTLIREFESKNVKVVNSSTSTIIAKDKLLSGQILSCHGVPVPKTMLVKFPIINVHEYSKEVSKELGFPCILKVNTGSFGHGVHLCRLEEEFFSLIQLIQTISPTSQILLQEYISTKVGHDLRVWVVGGEVIGAMQRKGADGDFRANISNGGTGANYPLNDQIVEIAGTAAILLGLDVAGVDLLFSGEAFTVCEVNSSPGFMGFEKYCGQNIAKAVVAHVLKMIEGHEIKLVPAVEAQKPEA
jgi:gamma-F420-2:alpha-L-glutamate ligase